MIIEIPKKRLDKVDEIAIHHGFRFTEIPSLQTKKETMLSPEEKNHVIKNYKKISGSNSNNSNPLMLYYDQPILINKIQKFNPRTHKIVHLDVIGVHNSIAEAMIINTASKILKDEGYNNYFIDINCTGDKESLSRFIEELSNYYKKNSEVFPCNCKNRLEKNNFSFAHCDDENCKELINNAPKPINFLSEKSRQHFKEVLEYLEDMSIPYRVNTELTSENNHYSKTVFEIKINNENAEEIVLAKGGRYDDVANKIAQKRNLPAVGLTMLYKRKLTNKAYSNKIEKPQIFLVQFGFKAKLKSFEVIDILRQNRVTVHQKLYKNKLSDQFLIAKKMKVPYMIIIGQKEAQDDEIIFRNMIDVTHEVVKINKLIQYLKKIHLV
ncbi:hypothetical protein A3E89_00620 [Candidatus Campbellbacteria bacterium RIFCSPHIGHO2_12_FULL_35_10]|uniref:Histidyl-tRNA synthetase n=1 Tax=Candidatus Campbellbacteria bacterium RIFCSPHIGHO2_12_FULL_35_10 TaxID=1797578 RepID=A0A1F5EN54_9BACT|nr:MAG: hypothetical protein A3E89_00620 [Candidatus Campbellbacteria bacterium RIFCSPHIGHO2_12_FULL_35_10]